MWKLKVSSRVVVLCCYSTFAFNYLLAATAVIVFLRSIKRVIYILDLTIRRRYTTNSRNFEETEDHQLTRVVPTGGVVQGGDWGCHFSKTSGWL